MPTPDELIGSNLARLRGDTMTQSELAGQMRDRGWKWSQSTVWSIEKGDRPVRLAEAEDLVDIFGLDGVHELTVSPVVTVVWAGLGTVDKAAVAVRAATHQLYEAQLKLAVAVDELEAGGEAFIEPEYVDQALAIDPHALVDLADPNSLQAASPRAKRLVAVLQGRHSEIAHIPKLIDDEDGRRYDEYRLRDLSSRTDDEFDRLVRSAFE